MIVGGGPAGTAAACLLGPGALLLERETGPAHKVCGEFLSGGALAALHMLGVDAAGLGAAPIHAMRLVHRGRTAETALPFPAAGLSRLVLDEALLARAAALGAEVRRGAVVRSAGPGQVLLREGSMAAPVLLLATGKHELRGLKRCVAKEPDGLVGFKLHLQLAPAQAAALAGHVEVVLLRGGYAGLQMVEGGTANLCLLADVATYGAAWPEVLEALLREEPHLARRLAGSAALWDRPLTIGRVPYGHVHRGAEDGVFRLGDQVAVIPSFCGDGMAIALESGRLAAEAVRCGAASTAYHAAMRRRAGGQVRLAQGLYRLTRSAAVREAAMLAVRAWPGLLRDLARRTRVGAAAG